MANPQPYIHAVTSLSLPAYLSKQIPNQMDFFMLPGGSEPVMKMELVFRAGAWYESEMAVAEVTAALLSEGTADYSSRDLAENIESLGATIQTRGGVDTIRIRLYTLTRFLPDLLPYLDSLLRRPAFDEHELRLYTANKIERLKIDLNKNEVLAYRHLTEAIYGPHHPYGRNTFPEDYQKIARDALLAHFRQYVKPSRGMVFLSGHFGDKEIDLLEDMLGHWHVPEENGSEYHPAPGTHHPVLFLEVDGPHPHQAAIRIGRKLFSQHHEDFNGLFVLNTILGGFFGSRLMNEIRENLGLTYSIYSGVDSFAHDGCFYISTETTTQQIDVMLKAIQLEIDKLQQELIPESELNMARNYLMGHLMTQLDGPFLSMDSIKTLKIERLPDSAFQHLIRTIQEITPEQLRTLAERYLDLEKWSTIVVR